MSEVKNNVRVKLPNVGHILKHSFLKLFCMF